MRSEIAQASGYIGAERAQLTVSIGAAAPPAGRMPLSQLIEGADRALYDAKAAGRDRVVARLAA